MASTHIFFFGFLIISIFSTSYAISIWDAFCKANILFTPYVRVYQKGRSGTLLRDRGPGFINLNGMQDIYICTNGLVMMYYTKTREMGEVFEQGELHWTPHHCELYNPSANEGVPGDHPKKMLKSILLIGHPKDLRLPALQIFVAPMFDRIHGDYVNMTSLIMMGTEGECMIEKGSEMARLRIRNQEPKYIVDMEEGQEKPPIFCRLDSQNKLGQKGLITLAKPGKAGLKEGDLFEFKEKKRSFTGTPFDKIGREAHIHNDSVGVTGSGISPRFRASSLKEKMFTGELGSIADTADDVYAALINDRKMSFVGCLRYPDFSKEQMKIISEKKNQSDSLDFSKDGLLIKGGEPGFWSEKVNVPWPDSADPKTNDERFKIFMDVDVDGAEVESYEDAKKKVDDAEAEVKTKTDPAEKKAAGDTLIKEQILLSLWPFKKAYENLYKHVKDLEEQVKKVWEKLYTDNFEELKDDTAFPDLQTGKLLAVADIKYKILKNLSEVNYNLRNEPYNRELMEFKEKWENQTVFVNAALRKRSVALGPQISNAEALTSKYKVYKSSLKRAMMDLEKGVTQIEKTGKPLIYPGGDAFEKQFVDTMIEIADAVKEDMSPYEDNLHAKACHELPSINSSCNAIKPTSDRAGQLLQNRKGKGKKFKSGPDRYISDDEWRQDILDGLARNFEKACPYIGNGFAVSVLNVLRGYLVGEPVGTGLKAPISGSRMESVNHKYQTSVYNLTYAKMGLQNATEGIEGELDKVPRASIYLSGLSTLINRDCFKEKLNIYNTMEFWHNEDGNGPPYITYKKYFVNNKTEVHYNVDDLMMLEKADLEYSFNWAIDMSWRIFATVLGACVSRWEKRVPHTQLKTYAAISELFFHPVRQIWISNRDNPVFQVIFGNYYAGGKAERWTKICMEASFAYTDMRHFRPPRSLYVNAFTEMNYFVTGPLAGTSGILSAVETPL